MGNGRRAEKGRSVEGGEGSAGEEGGIEGFEVIGDALPVVFGAGAGLGKGAVAGDEVGVGKEAGEGGVEGGDIAGAEGEAAVGTEDLEVFFDIADENTVAVGHGFDEAGREALDLGGEDIGVGMGEKGAHGVAGDEAEETDVGAGEAFEVGSVGVVIRAIPGDDEGEFGIWKGAVGLDQAVTPLLGDEAGGEEEVAARRETEGLEFGGRAGIDRRGAVGNIDDRAAVALAVVAGEFTADGGGGIRPADGGVIAELEERAGKTLPLGALPIQAVGLDEGGQAKDAGEWSEDGEAGGMNVNQVGAKGQGAQDGEEGAGDGIQAFGRDGGNVDEAHALPLAALAGGVMGTNEDGDAMTAGDEARADLFDDVIDPGGKGDALDTEHADVHLSGFRRGRTDRNGGLRENEGRGERPWLPGRKVAGRRRDRHGHASNRCSARRERAARG